MVGFAFVARQLAAPVNWPAIVPPIASSREAAGRQHPVIHLHPDRDFCRVPVHGARTPAEHRLPGLHGVQSGLANRLAARAGMGGPLPERTRHELEGGTGRTLGDVRVHADGHADTISRELGATAFTVGRDIFFRQGRYDPDSADGYRLLAHEITHTVQRPSGTMLGSEVTRNVAVSDPAGADERWAEAGADRLLQERDRASVKDGSADVRAPVVPPSASPTAQGLLVINRQTAKELVDTHTSMLNLDEAGLGRDLLRRALGGDPAIADQVLDEVGSTDRDDVSLAFMEAANDADVAKLASSADGRALLDRLYDELTAGSVGADEQKQADRIMSAKSRRIAPADFQSGVQQAKVFPFRLPGLTVLSPAPVFAERRRGGKVWVRQTVAVLGTDEYRDETRTLPAGTFTSSGIELPENEIIGVKMYDLGGEVQYRPALYLLQLANATDMKALSTAGEVAMLGLTLGSGALVGGGTTAAARVLLALDRVAFAAGTIASIISDHRGWILERFGDKGRAFLHYVDIVNSVVAVYGGVRALAGMGQLITNVARSVADWRAAAVAAESELNDSQRGVMQQVTKKADDLLNDIQAVQNEQASSGTGPRPAPGAGPPSPPPGAGSPPPPGGFEEFTAEGPMVRIPVTQSGAPARVLEIGAGPVDTNLGLPPRAGSATAPDPALIDLRRTDITTRPGVDYLNAMKDLSPEHVGRYDTVIINNPRGYVPDIEKVGQALTPRGRIIVQGKGEVFPGQRGINPDFNKLLKRPAPPGFRIVGGEPEQLPSTRTVLGSGFHRTTGGPVNPPNWRIIYERVQ